MTTITLTLVVNEAERAALVARFIQTAQAVTGEIDEDGGVPSDPNGSKVDSVGVIWDARFHGVNMTKNQDGTWRRKKNLKDAEKAEADAYEAGCKGAPSQVAQVAAGVVAPVVAAAPAADVPAFLQTGQFTPAPVTAPVMTMPGMPMAAPVALPVPAPTYDELIATFTATIARVGQQSVDANLAAIYQAAGVTDMQQLADDPEVRRSIKAGLERLA
jgi:hypothetical protein